MAAREVNPGDVSWQSQTAFLKIAVWRKNFGLVILRWITATFSMEVKDHQKYKYNFEGQGGKALFFYRMLPESISKSDFHDPQEKTESRLGGH